MDSLEKNGGKFESEALLLGHPVFSFPDGLSLVLLGDKCPDVVVVFGIAVLHKEDPLPVSVVIAVDTGRETKNLGV